MSEKNLPAPPALPVNLAALIEQRKRPLVRSLNDDVEQAHLALWDHPNYGERYRSLTLALWNPQAVEGATIIDDHEAARLIRDYAKENNLVGIGRCNLQSIHLSLGVVKRRYRLDRKYRRNLVGGETVGAPVEQSDFAANGEA
jgi:hypothetical protein